MIIVSRGIEFAEAAADGPALEAQMDQCKPATPAASYQAREVSGRRDAGDSAALRPSSSPPSSSPPAAQGGEPPRRRGDVPVDQHISRQLREIYDEVVNEPIPTRFVKLLEELERKQVGKS